MVVSEIIIIKLVIAGLMLFLVLWALKFVWSRLTIRRTYKTKLDRLFPMVEGLLWMGYLLWCIKQLIPEGLGNSLGVLAVVLLVFGMLFWFIVRDFLSGIILKSEGSLKINDWVRVKGIEGKITRMGQRSMVVVTQSGETVNIPYSTLSGEISIKPNPSEKLRSHAFEITIPKELALEITIEEIKRIVLNAPWSAIIKVPEIKLLNESPSGYHFEINIYSVKQIYFQKIKDYLKDRLEVLGLQPL